jgi:UDP-3-O-[3-hydroxymyristoyl] N-acetylglucosamine deacetylase
MSQVQILSSRLLSFFARNLIYMAFGWPHHDLTLAAPVTVAGLGLHSGQPARLTLQPRPTPGLVFRVAGVEIPALAEYVIDTRLNTRLGHQGVEIGTVEHVLSALYGLGVSAAWVDLEGGECPAGDGSADWLVRHIQAVGLQPLQSVRKRYAIQDVGQLTYGDALINWEPGPGLTLTYAVDFARERRLQQVYTYGHSPEAFMAEIAAARTFAFASELTALRAQGLAQGGTSENALLVTVDGFAHPPRWDNEPVRHKILDALGDFALLGAALEGKITLQRAGHGAHVTMVKHLRDL